MKMNFDENLKLQKKLVFVLKIVNIYDLCALHRAGINT